MQPEHLVVLAGGNATRLGPVTATMSKALVTVGSQPMIVRQVNGLRPKRVTVVASESNALQVEQLLERTYSKNLDFRVIVQPHANGPVNAITYGLRDARLGELTAIIMADSLYDFDVVQQHIGEQRDTWIAVAEGNGLPRRNFCWIDARGRRWEDSDRWEDVDYIFTGLIVTHDPGRWRDMATAVASSGPTSEVPMSTLLERLRAPEVIEIPWYDTGDISALAATVRELFIKRDHHGTSLDELGRFTKTGCTPEQVRYLLARDTERNPLFPRVFEADVDEGRVVIEYVDLPSLAELWLYWPGTARLWQDIVGRLLDVVDANIWRSKTHADIDPDVVHRLFIGKLIQRVTSLPEDERPAPGAVAQLVERLGPVVARPMLTLIHGDLNMTNILYSARTNTFKLLDPRGDRIGDLRYDLAKLRYSWHGFVKTVHEVPGTHGELWNGDGRRPMRKLDAVITECFPQVNPKDLAAIEASIFWSALPLHPPRQRGSLLMCGYDRLEAAKL